MFYINHTPHFVVTLLASEPLKKNIYMKIESEGSYQKLLLQDGIVPKPSIQACSKHYILKSRDTQGSQFLSVPLHLGIMLTITCCVHA